ARYYARYDKNVPNLRIDRQSGPAIGDGTDLPRRRPSRPSFSLSSSCSHPEKAEALFMGPVAVADGVQALGQDFAGFQRSDDAVVPEAGGGVVGRTIAVIAVADGGFDLINVFIGERFALQLGLLDFDLRQDLGRLVAAHHRDAGIGPG